MNEKEYLVMDESDAPFKEGEYEWTEEDYLFMLNMIKKDHLELNPDGELYKMAQKLNFSL